MPEPIKEALAPRRFALAAVVAIALGFVGAFLAAVGVFLLDVSGGAARDTSMVIVVAAFAVSDFWAGSLIAVRRSDTPQLVAISYGVAKGLLLALATIAMPSLAPITVAQLVLVAPAAFLGATVGLRQAALREAG